MSHAEATGRVGQVKEISSLANPLIKDIRALALKKFRDREQAFLAEGLKLVLDALEAGWTIRVFVYAKTARGNPAMERAAARTVASGGLVIETTEKVLSAITRRENPQTVMGVFAQRVLPLSDLRLAEDHVWVALDRVRDPGNLGTIIRTIDAVGAHGIILVGETADPFSLEAVRATMGSLFAVPIVKVAPSTFSQWVKATKVFVVGTHLEGATDYRSIDYRSQPVVLLMGNEQQGLPQELAALCNALVRIPQMGRADSLNLAVATGVMLYEIRRTALTLDGVAS